MAYDIKVVPAADRDIADYYVYILHNSNDRVNADRWLDGLQKQIASLKTMPARFPHVPEVKLHKAELRQTVYESHRVIFRIEDKVVRVLRVYPAAARPLTNLRQSPAAKKPR